MVDHSSSSIEKRDFPSRVSSSWLSDSILYTIILSKAQKQFNRLLSNGKIPSTDIPLIE